MYARLVTGCILVMLGVLLTVKTWGEAASPVGRLVISVGPIIAGAAVLLWWWLTRHAPRYANAHQTVASFILRRLGSGGLAILGVSVLVFGFLHLVPGDPIDHLAGGEATEAQRKSLEECMGLDQPLVMQFAAFVERVIDGSLGHTCPRRKNAPTVADQLREAFPHTVALAIAAMLVAILLALPLGVIAAIRRGSWIDTLATTVALSGIAIPQMMFAPLLLLLLYPWPFPGPTETGLAALVLPAFAVGTHLMAMLARMTRSSMVEVLGEDYVRTARAKGLPEWRVLLVHALRNALLPVITVAGLQFGSLLSGAIVVEHVFARPGLGTTLLEAIQKRDYPVVQGTVLVIALIYVLVNIAVDLTYGLADPRIRRS